MKTLRLFLWQAIDSQGQMIHGELISSEKNKVSLWLIEQGLQPYQINSGKRITSSQWRGEPLIQFTRQLATLLQAGLPLVSGLQLLAAEHSSPLGAVCYASSASWCGKASRFLKPSPDKLPYSP